MTREEAARIIKECKDKGFKRTFYTLTEYHTALDMAIKALDREPKTGHWIEDENADCIYCHEDSDGYVMPIEKNCHAFVRFGMDGWKLRLKANGWTGSAKIMYCPMCGRELKHDYYRGHEKAG